IGRNLNLTNCWVCGGTLESDAWPWRGVSLGPPEILKFDFLPTQPRLDQENWQLRESVIGEECIWRQGVKFTQDVGETTCKRYLVTNGHKTWWVPKEPDTFWAREQIRGKTC
ncbi:ENR1 protein, partial [Dryoscopus gambensis]|nr:ENR1 protein [Dryoscopus gambensis]